MDVGRAREADRLEMPIYFEGVGMRAPLRPAAIVGGAALAVMGVLLAVRWDGSRLELLGVLVALVGVAAAFLGLRCGRAEVTVNARWVALEMGPYRRRVPIGFVTGASSGPAGGWRRLFAAREVVVEVAHRDGSLPIPSREPDELRAAIAQARGEEPGAIS